MADEMKCPSCGAIESMWVKTAWAWVPKMVGWPWARRLEAVRRRVGECVVCLRCDWPYVVTPAGPFSRRPAPQMTQVSPGKRAADPLAQLLQTVNSMPDEPA